MLTDLLGQPMTMAEQTAKPRARPAGRAWKGGYAAAPGSGPTGETCRTCVHYVSTRTRSGRTFPKCLLMQHAWTHGPGSDIKARMPACNRWQAKLGGAVEL